MVQKFGELKKPPYLCGEIRGQPKNTTPHHTNIHTILNTFKMETKKIIFSNCMSTMFTAEFLCDCGKRVVAARVLNNMTLYTTNCSYCGLNWYVTTASKGQAGKIWSTAPLPTTTKTT